MSTRTDLNYRVVGEWENDWTFAEDALDELEALETHPVFSNQFWFLERFPGNKVILIF